jgi:succinate dehydrogenase / fumarate reductase, membrane anchor subunit
MTSRTTFISGRSGRGAAYVSDASGTPHDKFMRLTARALAPLGALSAWFVIGLAGKSFEAARAELAHPFPALVLIAFILVAMPHARQGVESIVTDYVHDAALKEKALLVNKWVSIAIAALWTLAVLLIAAPR